MKNNRILDLSLKHRWYDMIASGEKTEEYREFSPYYANRLLYERNIGAKCWEETFDDVQKSPWLRPKYLLYIYGSRNYDAVRFHRGQGSPVTMLLEFEGLEIGKGKPEWGAPKDKDVFIIKLGKIINSKTKE